MKRAVPFLLLLTGCGGAVDDSSERPALREEMFLGGLPATVIDFSPDGRSMLIGLGGPIGAAAGAWREGRAIETLGRPEEPFFGVWAISEDGRTVVGQRVDDSRQMRASLWRDGTRVFLPPVDGKTVESAIEVASDGTIYGYDPATNNVVRWKGEVAEQLPTLPQVMNGFCLDRLNRLIVKSPTTPRLMRFENGVWKDITLSESRYVVRFSPRAEWALAKNAGGRYSVVRLSDGLGYDLPPGVSPGPPDDSGRVIDGPDSAPLRYRMGAPPERLRPFPSMSPEVDNRIDAISSDGDTLVFGNVRATPATVFRPVVVLP